MSLLAGIALILAFVVLANVALVVVAWRLSRPRPLPPISVTVEAPSRPGRVRRPRPVPHRDRQDHA